MSTYGDLMTLKVGDTVLLDGYYGELTRAVVEKIGKFHITAGGRKFKISTGRALDSSTWNSTYLRLWDEDHWQASEKKRKDAATCYVCGQPASAPIHASI